MKQDVQNGAQFLSPANEGELAIIGRALARLDKIGAQHSLALADVKATGYMVQGNFFTALISTGELLYVGTAKRNPIDGQDLVIAMNIALTRAAKGKPIGLPAKEKNIMKKNIKRKSIKQPARSLGTASNAISGRTELAL